MNKVYLEKLIEQEKQNAKLQLIKEHIAIAKKEQLFFKKINSISNLEEHIKDRAIQHYVQSINEFKIDSRVELDTLSADNKLLTPKDKIERDNIPTWNDQKDAATAFEKLNANIFLAGKNPYGYELDVNVASYEPPPKNKDGKYIKGADGKIPPGKMVNTGKQDRIWFYNTGRCWSTNATIKFGWEYGDVMSSFGEMEKEDSDRVKKILKDNGISGNVIKLFNVSKQSVTKFTAQNLWGVIIPDTKTEKRKHAGYFLEKEEQVTQGKMFSFAKLYDSEDAELASAEEKAEVPWLDKLQTALDWAGLAPVIGDALDFVNALIYFARWWASGFKVMTYLWQGLLSCLAIIPMIGSVIAVALKSVIKVVGGGFFKLLFKVGQGQKKFWQMLFLSMSPESCLQLSMTFTKIGERLKKILKFIKDKFNFRIGPADEIADGLVKQERSFKQVLKERFKRVRQMFPNLAPGSGTTYEASKAWYHRLTLGSLNKLKQASWWPTGKIETIAKTMDMNFARGVAKNPSKYLDDLNDVEKMKYFQSISGGYDELIEAAVRSGDEVTLDVLTNTQFARYLKNGAQGPFPGNDAFIEFSKQLNRLPGDSTAQLYRQQINKQLVDTCKTNGSGFYNRYTENELNQLVAAFRNRSTGGPGSLANMYNSNVNPMFTFSKRWDVIYNEVQDVSEDLDMGPFAPESTTIDQKQGVVYSLTKEAVKAALPASTINFMKDTATNINPTVVNAFTKSLTVAADTLGIDAGQFGSYDPEATAGGDYA